MVRARDIRHRHSSDRRVEVEEGLIGNDRRDLSAEAAGPQILMDDEAAASSPDAFKHHFLVPGLKRAQIDHIGAETVRGNFAARDHRAQVTIVILSPCLVFFARPNGRT